MESIVSIIDNLPNFSLFASSCFCSFVIVRIVVAGEFGRFPFGRFKLLLFCCFCCCCCSWLAGSIDADRSLGVSKEIDDGIWWILNAELFWSNFILINNFRGRHAINSKRKKKNWENYFNFPWYIVIIFFFFAKREGH